MMTLLILAFSFPSSAAEACRIGEARVGQGKNGPAIEVCRNEGSGPAFVNSQQGTAWYDFFTARQNDKAFVAMAEKTTGLKYDQILKGTDGVYGRFELYSDDKDGLKGLADEYSKWSVKNAAQTSGKSSKPSSGGDPVAAPLGNDESGLAPDGQQ